MKSDVEMLQKQFASEFTGWFQILDEIWKISDVPMSEYERMLHDESVAAALDLLVHNTRMKIGDYVHPDSEITSFVNANFEHLEEGLPQVLNKLLRNLFAYGYAVGELVWDATDKLMLKKIIVLDSSAISFVLEGNKNGGKNIGAVKYRTLEDEVVIPIWKCILLQRDRGTDGFGRSILRRAYRAYKFKEILFKYWAVAMERYAAPILYGRTSGDPEKMANVLKDVWRNGVVAVYETDNVGVIEPKHNVGETFQQVIEYANTLIFRALLIPQLLVKQENVGAYSLAKVHLEVFDRYITEEAKQVADVFIDQVVARILEYNFSNVEEYGCFVAKQKIPLEMMQTLTNVFVQLMNVGVLDPIADNEYIRNSLNIPKLEE